MTQNADLVRVVADSLWEDTMRWIAADNRPIPHKAAELAVEALHPFLGSVDEANERMGRALSYIKHLHPEVYIEALAGSNASLEAES